MNVIFTSQQRHALARILLVSAAVIGLVTLAAAAKAHPNGFARCGRKA